MSRICHIVHRSQLAPGGVATALTLGCFREGQIQEIAVSQQGGLAAAFTVAVYSTLLAVPPADSSANDPDTTEDDVGESDLYKVMPNFNATAGNVAQYANTVGVPFRNKDGGPTNAIGRIYVVITPEGSGDKTWDVSIKGTVNVG